MAKVIIQMIVAFLEQVNACTPVQSWSLARQFVHAAPTLALFNTVDGNKTSARL
jgi:hypothetical protein